MNKILLIIAREYKTRVAKRSFLLLTILVPVLIFGFYGLIIAVAVSGSSEAQKVAVIDNASLFNGQIENKKDFTFTVIKNETEESFYKKYSEQGYTSFLYIPPFDISKNDSSVRLYSESQIGPITKSRIEKTVNNAIEKKRMEAYNIDAEKMKNIKSDISIEDKHGTGKYLKKGSAESTSVVGYVSGILIYITMFIYGMMVMRGVMEEKINRIAEVIVSSVKPFQLMMGKIIGIAAVGLTQFIIWIFLVTFLNLLIVPLFMHGGQDIASQAGQVPMQPTGVGSQIIAGFSAMNFPLIIVCFIFYFIGGYLQYASLFAAVGSVVSEDQQEAQQLTLPITMPIILAFVIMTRAAAEPNSALAIFGSLFPLTSPIVMMARIPYGVPWWQLGLSMALLILGFMGTVWLAGKIYRTGILLYGKKVTWRVMWKWAFRKS